MTPNNDSAKAPEGSAGEGRDRPSGGVGAESVVRALADASREAILVTDASGRVAYVNAAAERVLRRPGPDVIGLPGWTLFEPSDHEQVRDVFAKGLASPGHPCTVEVRIGDGVPPIALTVTNYEPPPAAQTVVIRLREATEDARANQREQELEAQLRQAQKMMAVGQMTAGIAHDFNNILAVITATADLIEQAIDPASTDLAQDVRTLREAADSGSTLVGKLMGFSRTAPVCPVPTNVGSLLQRLTPMLDRLLPERIALELIVPPDEVAHCDPKAVEQIVMNLVTNARDALGRSGRIRLTVANRVVESEEPTKPEWLVPGSFVRVSVQDDGSGMDETTRMRALEPFFTTKQSGSGTGLGLAMVYGLTKQQGGFLELVSEVGQGTTVHVYLPKPAPVGRKASRDRPDDLSDSSAPDSRSA